MKIKLGTRGSKLALWQAYHVADLLKQGGVESEIITIDTKGDKILDVSIAKIGSKGVFTEEIEEQLAAGHIDIAVHSAKDMQSELPEGFELIAFTERERVNDVVVSHNPVDLSRPLKLGTSSTRRVALLKRYFPHIEPVSVRGNLQTRIRKMEEGHCDALLLAYAGVHRMGYESMIQHYLSLEEFTPPVGQGTVAIEVHSSLEKDKKAKIKELVNHPPTETRLLAERAFLRKLQGGCSVPVYALATLDGNQLTIKGGVVSLDGQERLHAEFSGKASEPFELGSCLADAVIEQGADVLLRKIKGETAH
jgi:hydroxymethylbilane synthase